MSQHWSFDMSEIVDNFYPVAGRDPDDEPETAICDQCGETAYMSDDGFYVCMCGNEFDGDDD